MDSLFPPDQLALFDLPAGQTEPGRLTVADWCALYFAMRFRQAYRDCGSPEQIPSDVDIFGFACLLVIAENKMQSIPRLVHELIQCRECLLTIPAWRNLDTLHFDICLELLGYPSKGIQSLQRYLANGNSSVRRYVFDVAWFARPHLTYSAVGSCGVTWPLMKNVADTLGYWDHSLALCRSLFTSREEFWNGIASYVPDQMQDQYAKRIQWAHENMERIEYHPHFLELELRVRRLIDTNLLRMVSLHYPPVINLDGYSNHE